MKRFEDLAKKRRTTYEFSTKKVPDNLINRLLECARWAPSAGNSQPWYFILVKNRKRIAALIDSAYYGAFHSDPPCIIAIVLDKDRYVESEFRFVRDSKIGIVEGLLSAANPALQIALMAEDLGLSSAILTPEADKVHEILDTREGDFCPIMIGIDTKRPAHSKRKNPDPSKKLVFIERHGGTR